jgi:hypothetical protein
VSEREPIIDERSPDYWLGYLAGSIEGAIRTITDSLRAPEAAADLKRALREWQMSPAARPGVWIAAYAVEDALGEVYAIRDSRVAAEEARSQAYDYLYGAESSGHPRAAGWVAERLPFAVVTITAGERDAIMEEGTPVLDREP